MWKPYRNSFKANCPGIMIIYDKLVHAGRMVVRMGTKIIALPVWTMLTGL